MWEDLSRNLRARRCREQLVRAQRCPWQGRGQLSSRDTKGPGPQTRACCPNGPQVKTLGRGPSLPQGRAEELGQPPALRASLPPSLLTTGSPGPPQWRVGVTPPAGGGPQELAQGGRGRRHRASQRRGPPWSGRSPPAVPLSAAAGCSRRRRRRRLPLAPAGRRRENSWAAVWSLDWKARARGSPLEARGPQTRWSTSECPALLQALGSRQGTEQGAGSRSRELPARAPAMAVAAAQKLSHLLSGLRLAGAEPGPPEPVFTVGRAEVPPLFWKPYIYAGYRPLHRTWRFYFRTLFQQHNEAVNVWTHLLAALALLLRLAAFAGSADFRGDPHALPLFLIVLASFTYLSFSALAHLLQAKSEFWHYSFFFLDYVGVAVYQFGSALAHFYYAIEPSWHAQVQAIFLPAAAFLAWLSCTGSCYNKYSQKPGLLGRTCQEVPSALAYALDISPVVHRILVSPHADADDPALLYHKCQVVFFLLAAAFFSTVVPERWFPGSCHLFGQGHQVFHVFLVLCTLAQLEAVTLDYEARRPIYEPLHTRCPHNFSGLFLLTVGSSILTAGLLSQLVRRKLDQKTK